MVRTDQRRVPVVLIVIAAVLLVARFTCSPEKRQPEGGGSSSAVQWLSPAEGMARAKATGKPLLIDFTAEWCGPCHMLERNVFNDASIAARINDRFIPIRATDRLREEGKNPPAVAELEQRYGVRGFPTVVFADAGGVEQARIEGYRGPRQFKQVMESVR
jgi:thiol:disulfide interchange protein